MPTKKPSLKRLSPMDLYPGQQSWESQSLWTYGPHKLRVLIDRDSYDFQSTIRAFVWTASLEWSLVATIPFELAPAPLKAVSYVQRPTDKIPERKAAFEEAETLVLKAAVLVLAP